MVNVFVLLDIHPLVFYHYHSSLVVVGPTVVRSRKHSDNRRESVVSSPSMHLIAVDLNLMRPDY